MLAGIKRGKRKRKSNDVGLQNQATTTETLEQTKKEKLDEGKEENEEKVEEDVSRFMTSSSRTAYGHDNRKVAEELRQLLSDPTINPKSSSSRDHHQTTNTITTNDTISRYEKRRGAISTTEGLDHTTNECNNHDNNEMTVILHNDSSGRSGGQKPGLQKEDLRNHGSRRKGKVRVQESSMLHANAEKSISDMVEEEKRNKLMKGRGGVNSSLDEVFATNVVRLGSKYKGSDLKSIAGSSAGADEDDMALDGGVDMSMYIDNDSRLTKHEKYNREVSRQIAYQKKTHTITSRCWWWIESSSFQRHRLLSLGDHVSMCLVPSHMSLVPLQCYLVPISHAESFVSCEDEVWNEITNFRSSLRRMFKEQNKGVIFLETVLPSKGLWQTKMDVIPVPLDVEHDAEIYFKSAMNSQCEEWGTHIKVLSTRDKGVRRTIPKGFPYFNVEWSHGGFAQIIEKQSFSKDFGLDTIAGMMELDPMKFKRKNRAPNDDRNAMRTFLDGWKGFDWTLSLDEH